MSQENQNPLGAQFWEFIQSMDNLGIDPSGPPPPPNDPHHPPPHPHGPPPPHPHSPHPPPHAGPPGPPPPPPGQYSRWRLRPELRGADFDSDFVGMGYPFDVPTGGGPWEFGGRGRHGRGTRHGHPHRRGSPTPSSSGSGSRSRSRSPGPRPEAEGAAREEEERPSSPRGHRGPPPHQWGGRRGRHGWRRGGPPPYGAWGHHAHHRGPPPPPAWDPTMLSNLATHPVVRNILQSIGSFGSQMNPQNVNNGARNATDAAGDNDDSTFTPPTDVFTTPTAYTLHISLPGAKKEDIGVHYASTTSTLTVSGVIYRPGNEEFLATMTSAERRVGMFEKTVVLKGNDGGEVDGDGITAKLEDGVLIVTVPRVEREWEDVKRVDIE